VGLISCSRVAVALNARNYYRRVAKYGGRRSKSSVAKVNPWCFVVAENTPKFKKRLKVEFMSVGEIYIHWNCAHCA